MVNIRNNSFSVFYNKVMDLNEHTQVDYMEENVIPCHFHLTNSTIQKYLNTVILIQNFIKSRFLEQGYILRFHFSDKCCAG